MVGSGHPAGSGFSRHLGALDVETEQLDLGPPEDPFGKKRRSGGLNLNLSQ
jgi:hypothetical protein